MYRYKCVVSYDGSNYMGFQIQDNLKTIELELKNALYNLVAEEVKIYPSGRTDRYVHAVGQVIHFDLNKDIPVYGIKCGLNSFLPEDIHIMDVKKVDESFHARFSCKSKEYRYYINTYEYNPLTVKYAPFLPYLDVSKMEEAAKLLVGTHDFKGFASASINEKKDTIKTIFSIDVHKYDKYIEFIFIGTGFLKYQIRRMMGLLIDIGRGKEKNNMLIEVLEKKDPSISHGIAPGCGLYLYKVNY